jgi:hypothetical protein
MEPVALGRVECLRLLAVGAVGRLVHTRDALPTAQPVGYLLDGTEIVFRTGPASALADTVAQVVGFEVDAFDVAARTGWSVLGVGVAYEIVDPARLAALADRVPEPWADDRASHTVAVPLRRLTGRLIIAAPAG